MPEPSGDHMLPSQRAMRFTAIPPMVEKPPPATRSPFGSASSAETEPPNAPWPSGDHVDPFQRAILFTVVPPELEKLPPATMSPFGRRAKVWTDGLPEPPSPDPS